MSADEIKKIKKRDGRIVDFDASKITRAIFKAMEAVGETDFDLAKELSSQVVDILLGKLSSGDIPTVEEVQDIVERVLIESDESKVAKAYILYRHQRTKIREKKKKILNKEKVDEVDKSFKLSSLQVLASRYLRKDEQGEIMETPKQMFTRVATHVTLSSILHDDKIFDKKTEQEPQQETPNFDHEHWGGEVSVGRYDLNQFHLKALLQTFQRMDQEGKMKVSWKEFFDLLQQGEFDSYEEEIERNYEMMTSREFLPNTPTLANFGNVLAMGSACFVLDIEDSLESIMDAVRKTALIFKAGGGVGYNFSKLRPEGDVVASTGGVSSGPISFMTLFDKVTDVIKQGGLRRGASIGVMDIDHPDIEKFIIAKRGNRQLRNFNLSVFIKPEFWEYYEKDKPYPLVNPRNGQVVKKVNPRDLFNLLVYQSWESAEPGVIFGENINDHNPLKEELGEIKSTNPCVTGDTWVMTEKGPRQVEDLINQQVKVVVDESEHATKNGFFQTGTRPVLRLQTKEGYQIDLTADHLVKKVTKKTRSLLKSEWKRARQLQPGDEIVLNPHRGIEWPGKYNQQQGYLVGFWVGDGTSGERRVFLQSWGESAGCKKVRAVVESYADELPHRSDFNGWHKCAQRYRLSIASLRDLIIKDLELGTEKNLTPKLEKTSSDFYKGFLRGFFDADGSVQGTHRSGVNVRLAQSNLERLRTVQRMLLRLGIFSRIYTNRRRAGKRKLPDGHGGYKKYNIKAQHELTISTENLSVFYDEIGFEDIDKKKKLKTLLNQYRRSLHQERFTAVVEQLTPLGEKEVYDCQVPGKNAFEANGFLIHNCGEVPLYPLGSCNLGSINVWAFIKEKPTDGGSSKEFDWEELEKVVRDATRFLDNVIDINDYPLPEIEEHTLKTRKVGLGLMGLADLLYELELPYDSEEGRQFMEKLMEFVNYHSTLESAKLAEERGCFDYYENSFYPQGKLPIRGPETKQAQLDWPQVKEEIQEKGLRNTFTTICAPTGSISMIAACSSGIEPLYSLVYEKNITIGSFYKVDSVFEKEMKREGLFDDQLIEEISDDEGSIQDLSYIPPRFKKIFVTSMDIAAEDHVRAVASLQKWVDGSISKTINFPQDATVEEMKKAYLLAHELNCKDTTVFRNRSITGVYQAGGGEDKEEKPKEESHESKKGILQRVKEKIAARVHSSQETSDASTDEETKCPQCNSSLIRVEGCQKCPVCGWGKCS